MTWELVSGPREFKSTGRGHDMDVGWRYELGRDGQGRTISVIVARGRLASPALPDECRRAIDTMGRSAIDAVLDRDLPPEIIFVTTVGLREQPPPGEVPERGGKTVTCGQCGRTLPERSDIPPEKRPPCPQCGSTTRTFLVQIEDHITVGGTLSADLVEAIAPPEPAQPATADMLEAGFKVVWYCYPDGLYLVQVFDDAGELIDAGGGNDPVEALLEVAQRLLPPRAQD